MNHTISDHIAQFAEQKMNLEPSMKDYKITFIQNGVKLERTLTTKSRKQAESILLKYYGDITFLGCKETNHEE